MAVSAVIPGFEKRKEVLRGLLLSDIVSCQSIKGGRNSQVYKIECANGESFIGKFYYQGKDDPRNRLGVEYSSLEFLWQKGMRCIPQPLQRNPQNSCAIYQFVPGNIFSGQEIIKSDIDQVIDFIVLLQGIKKDMGGNQFPIASSASFSMQQLFDSIEWRRKRFNEAKHIELREFLDGDFDVFLAQLLLWGKQMLVQKGISLTQEIPLDKRTLSPSDLGFHNAIKRADGKIVFCDFEYFGWDDPAKLISDFLLHPAMSISEDLKKLFVKEVQGVFAADKQLSERLSLVYPFYGMIWCLILLNEFLAHDFSKRLFANHQVDEEKMLKEQLDKAKNMLTKIRTTYNGFPYATK